MSDLSDLLAPEEPEPIPAILDEKGMCALLGLTSARLRELARDGILVRVTRGRYDTRQSLKNHLERLRSLAATAGRPASDDAKAERLRLTRAQADAQEIKNAALRRELVPADEVRQEWLALALDLRSALLAISGRVGARLSLNRAAIAALDEEVRIALETLPDGA